MKKRWMINPEQRARLRAALESAGNVSAGSVSTDQAAEARITEWLARLRNLHGVPYYALIPDVRMLPQESIRMFRMDDNWTDCLIDGAFSLGRSTTGIEGAQREARLLGRLRAGIRNRAATQRVRRIFGAASERAAAESRGIETGFLMRSAVVAGWPTLEVRGYDAAGAELRVIRLDRPASDVLFCIFDGEAAKVSLSEPAEMLHFGFENDGKTLKYVDAAGHAPGTPIEGVRVTVPLRDAARRVVAVDALAGAVHDALVAAGGMPAGAEYTTAEFALELVQGVEQVDFTIGAPV
ncbi:MAG TPA: hypothetical protein VEO54_02825 [Thermoanaerobaculia bacterium]|nr:hypothetical protein [Thermoanaerobaculia bacterium]